MTGPSPNATEAWLLELFAGAMSSSEFFYQTTGNGKSFVSGITLLEGSSALQGNSQCVKAGHRAMWKRSPSPRLHVATARLALA